MTFEVELGGRSRTITVERLDRSGRFRVTVDDRRYDVDAVRVGGYGLSILAERAASETVPFSGGGGPEKVTVLSADIQLTPGSAPGELLATMEGRTVALTLNGRRSPAGADADAHGHGEVAVIAPMPGRVVRVLVAPGADVVARQGLVVVEAMKMENELRAPRAGRVKDVSVEPGMSVEAGRILAVIE